MTKADEKVLAWLDDVEREVGNLRRAIQYGSRVSPMAAVQSVRLLTVAQKLEKELTK
jgi:hypothetical protein